MTQEGLPYRNVTVGPAFLAFFPLAYLSYKGLVPLLAAIVVPILFLGDARRVWDRIDEARPILYAVAAFLAWIAVSGVWSPDGLKNLRHALLFAALLTGCAILIASAVLPEGSARFRGLPLMLFAGLCLATAMFFGIPLLPLELTPWRIIEDGMVRTDAPYIVALSVVLIPLLRALWQTMRPTTVLIAATLAVAQLAVSTNLASKLAIVTAAGAFVAAAWDRRAFAGIVIVVLIALDVLLVASCMTARTVFEWLREFAESGELLGRFSVIHRLYIYDFVNTAACDSTWLGLGLDGIHRLAGASAIIPELDRVLVPSHPHNALLHVWIEFGIVGLALYSTALAMGALWIGHAVAERWTRATLAAAFTGFMVVQQVSFSLWASWWWALGSFGVFLSLIGGTLRTRTPRDKFL